MDSYTEFAVEVLRKLIAIPTVNPPGDRYAELATYLKNVLESIGGSVELIEVPEEYLDRYYPYAPSHKGRKRLIVYAKFSPSPEIHVNAHYDVVPPGGGWSKDPFNPVIENGAVYGRGASDDKAGIACIIASVKKLVDSGIEPRVELAFVPDEESGGIGTRYLVEEVGVKPKRVLVAEPTTSERIAIGHKGVIRGIVKVHGKQGHAAAPWRCINAFEEGCRVAIKFLESVRSEFAKYRSSYPFECEEARFSTIALGGIARSLTSKENIIPGEFEFSFDARIVPELSIDLAKEKILRSLRAVASTTRAEVDVEIRGLIEASVTDPREEVVTRLLEIASEVLGTKPRVFVNSGRYDSVYYVRKGVPAVIYGPGARGVAHAPDEHVPIEELARFVNIYSRFIESYQ
ncbi:MAG: M20 family metallopeptidase [Crenarchaeota archaeon]|nr:M20 family metallopeptidase [Thermoproteota archaeon]